MRKFSLSLLAAASIFSGASLHAGDLNIGFVNFKECVENSKQGQREKNAFEALKKNMTETLEKTDKELEAIAKKLEDQDYMDGLSPAAEEQLKGQFQNLSQEFSRYQNQYYQLLNQANYKMLQTMHDQVATAAEAVRAKRELALILNEESAFAHAESLDFTSDVIAEMNKTFETDIPEIAQKTKKK